jgi:hypothetical protein
MSGAEPPVMGNKAQRKGERPAKFKKAYYGEGCWPRCRLIAFDVRVSHAAKQANPMFFEAEICLADKTINGFAALRRECGHNRLTSFCWI